MSSVGFVRASVAMAVLLELAWLARGQSTLGCRTFEKIYTDGKGLCESMWGDAFRYVSPSDPSYDLAYTMWFSGNTNPNDAVTARRIAAGKHDPGYSATDVCHLDYFHLDVPQSASDFTECRPWESNACCKQETVKDSNTLKESYGPQYHWDRCGPMSQECERFFVQELCFYECDVNAGLFRKHAPTGPTNVPGFNAWELEAMPIRGDYCDAFFNACREQLFCAENKGNIFSCARVFEPTPDPGTCGVDGDPCASDDSCCGSGVCVAKWFAKEKPRGRVCATPQPNPCSQSNVDMSGEKKSQRVNACKKVKRNKLGGLRREKDGAFWQKGVKCCKFSKEEKECIPRPHFDEVFIL